MTSRATKLLAEARTFLDSAEQKQNKADADKWAAAERMWIAHREESATMTEIAAAVGLQGHSSVSRHITVWEHFRAVLHKPSFWEAWSQVVPSTGYEPQKLGATRRHLRESTPEQVAAILEDPEIRINIAKAQDLRHTEQKQRSEKAYREAIGEDAADALDSEQQLRDAESKAFEARRALRDMLALLNETDLDAMRDSWREDFLKTLDDLAMRVDVARSLLGGTLDADLERFLSEV